MRSLSSGVKITGFLVIVAVAWLAETAMAQVETPESQRTHHPVVKDYKLIPATGKVLNRALISRVVGKAYKGARPKITRAPSRYFPNCHKVRFLYKETLKRVSFNCTGTTRELKPKEP